LTDLFAGPKLAADGVKGLGAAMAGGAPKVARRALDFYPTPPEATRALLLAEGARLRGEKIWEPCARGGAILRVLDEFGLESVGTDIVADPAHRVTGADLFDVRQALAQHVVTNMPFAIARRMVGHLWNDLRVDYMALLFKVQFLNCGKGAQLYQSCPPTRRWDLTWRLDFTGGGNPTMDCVWLVWDRIDTVRDFGLLDVSGPVRPLAEIDLFAAR
jgi:hypothetical protein